MEIWDLYDISRKPLGKTHIRGEKLPSGAFHLVVHVWIKNSAGLYLMSRRSADRYSFPLKWECPGGSVIAGEDSAGGALREVFEEVGVRLDISRGKRLFSRVRDRMYGKDMQDIMDVWLFDYDGDADLKAATTAEVCETEWMSREKIRQLYDTGELVSTLDYFFFAVDVPDPDYSGVIGKRVSVVADRPLGSAHPDYPGLIYPVNYGYAEGITGGDGEEQDVYILGLNEPVERYEGEVAAVIHRYNDCEDKWVVIADGVSLSDDEIIGQTVFQEQYFYGKLYRR